MSKITYTIVGFLGGIILPFFLLFFLLDLFIHSITLYLFVVFIFGIIILSFLSIEDPEDRMMKISFYTASFILGVLACFVIFGLLGGFNLG
ncbi:MAG: hypothetical protein KBD55_01460 [Candidatus Pacebacteria bacterium]|jgi:hypothetical protein|nr:hypothetical protein [Candidatus Paceibacterota bacterium]